MNSAVLLQWPEDLAALSTRFQVCVSEGTVEACSLSLRQLNLKLAATRKQLSALVFISTTPHKLIISNFNSKVKM